MRMKKFHLFAGHDYYPSGFHDYRGSYELLDDAVNAGATWIFTDWYEVLATKEDGTLEIVTSGRNRDNR